MEKPNTAEEESIPVVQGKMDAPPLSNAGPPQKKVAAVKEGAPLFSCGLCDAELVHKLAQVLLMGLSAACVDNTTGDLFKTPATVAVDMRREMVDYVTGRSETFVAETVIEEGNEDAEVLDNPTEIVSLFLDDFASSKRNLLGRVSNWLISERREDKIDEFVQEMEANGFWLVERRESVAEILLKNVDYKCLYHCDVKCESMGDLVDHKDECGFRVLSCNSEGCRASFCAKHLDKHESVCPFKLLQCEQKCPEIIMRCEMDKHCLTICPMKLTNCPFHQVGCQAGIPRCTVEQHCSEALREHVLQVLKTIHNGETEEHLRQRMEEMAKLPGFDQLAGALSVRNLTWEVKDLETELKTQETQKAEENQKTSEDDDIEKEKEKTGKVEIGEENQKETQEEDKIGEENQKETQEEDKIGEENQKKTREMEIGEENQMKTREMEIGKENQKTQEEEIGKENQKTQESEIAKENQKKTQGEEIAKENQKKTQGEEIAKENQKKTLGEEIGKENQKKTQEDETGSENQAKQENGIGKENQKTQENEIGKENQKTQENETGNENQKTQEDETTRGNQKKQEKQEYEIGMQNRETQDNEREKENQKTQEKEFGMENRETQENEREKEIQMN
ncbi:hypothetical protein H6P81_004723 [Aristolochia fimbriata]|uniref:TRAF-type domain-containing protein n=1 Tax=Aristolochia fimbriata TaxID=158543 RepID=A0AAV7ETD8_ARIFI|nr:hypothetical protein H6P81_004723 [Aristolochia fimbriata]